LGFLRENTPDEANLLMRLTDDYLFVTTSLQKANRVIESLLRCAKENNFEINEEKVKTNFPFSMKNGVISPVGQSQISTSKPKILIIPSIDLALLKWCGKIINTENFEIMPAFEIEEMSNYPIRFLEFNSFHLEMYYSVNVKLTTYNVFEFLKNKLKR